MASKWVVAGMAGLFILLGGLSTAMADTGAGQWKQDGSDWVYQNQDGKLSKNKWQQIGGHWYFFDRDGYMVTGWMKIGGYLYSFRDTGDLVVGWSYDDDGDKWHYFNKDGTIQRGWLKDGGSWYWFTNRGEMVSGGYRYIGGKRYYFFDNGKMAENQYVGLLYMDGNGQHDQSHDMEIEGKTKESAILADEKNQITKALENVPGQWIKYMLDHGWQFLYYPDKSYFSAPESGGDVYYVYHKLDTRYRKVKFCKPEALTQVMGEYMGYVSGCYEKNSPFAVDLSVNQGNVDDFVDVPDYYLDDMQFYFGKLVEAYLNEDVREEMEKNSPGVCAILKKVVYGEPGKVAT